MTLTKNIKKYIDQSVLCWLATASLDNIPNVSPKEIFTVYDDKTIIIANVASPQTAKNIKDNPKICLSFIDVLVQKGYQLKGKTKVVPKSDAEFESLEKPLLEITEGKFPFASIFKITVESAKPIIAPRYILYPETTEEAQIESAKKSYGF
ncbi:pyridoxamine 5'-phosphate oxidase family protein [Seonamhaeicola maritimus]|uniref:Pyridoxamine 5'-phosphate oxidase family protein n=1 Tax=Seonamhaeicola maritimus TaxID=2591822 RepID=A0A5C7GJI4_9FLAO|nr:pyridoxamine 5'-phosphate oxidase family protein [Seonamhaeicola maritimus]TXG37345.1 pyridoxamine 5'-phosphate oxidase family protein [Seonamhaeicola maritimus]